MIGVSRGFAFAEFHIIADAKKWMELKKVGVVVTTTKLRLYVVSVFFIYFRGYSCSMTLRKLTLFIACQREAGVANL